MLNYIKRLYKSIALYPSLLALFFLLFSILLSVIEVDYDRYSFLNLFIVDSKTDSQYIFSFVIGGVFTLTIFSYTMVMNVLNRSINNYSPRLVPLILSERHHQLILGFTSGTIIYAIVMSIALVNKSDSYFPKIAPGLAVIFSIICVLLFIYFIHRVSRSIHVNYIIHQVFEKSQNDLNEFKKNSSNLSVKDFPDFEFAIEHKAMCGYLHDFDVKKLMEVANELDISIAITRYRGEFILEGQSFIKVNRKLKEDEIDKIKKHFVVDHTVCSNLFETNVKHLIEVSLKASSPAINDPGTAINALDYLTQLMIFRFQMPDYNCFERSDSSSQIFFSNISKQELYCHSYDELYHYMEGDPILKKLLDKTKLKLRNLFPEDSFLQEAS